MGKVNAEEVAHGIELMVLEVGPFLARALNGAFKSRHGEGDAVVFETAAQHGPVKARVVCDEEVVADEFPEAGPELAEVRSRSHVLLLDPVDAGKPGQYFHAFRRLDQGIKGFADGAAPHAHDADRAGARLLVTGRLEVDRAEVKAYISLIHIAIILSLRVKT